MKKDYISPELELISLSLSKNILGASTNPTDVPEVPISSGDEGEDGLLD